MARMSATLTTHAEAGSISQELAEQFREAMIARGITITELGKRLSISRPSASLLLDGSSMTTTSIERIAKAIGLKAKFFLVEDDVEDDVEA